MTREEFMRDYWRYYLLLEEKFRQTINYVELSEDNFSTYSIEYAYLLQSIGGELDTFFKVYCGFPLNDRNKDMRDYRNTTIANYPGIVSQKVSVQEYGLELQPFKAWSHGSVEWWSAYNSLKHNRSQNIKCASQKNVLNALSALNILEIKYLSEIVEATDDPDCPDQPSEIFKLVGWNMRYMPFGKTGCYISFEEKPD